MYQTKNAAVKFNFSITFLLTNPDYRFCISLDLLIFADEINY